jgi:SAM-dependent methyltransferase
VTASGRENAARERGGAAGYDRHRPVPPAAIVERPCELANTSSPVVVDLGCATGNSTRIWLTTASRVIGVEPNAESVAFAANQTSEIEFRQAFASDTGLPAHVADIVTCVQALHWMEPVRTRQEIHRILRPNGIFAAIVSTMFPTDDPSIRETLYAAKEYVAIHGLVSAQKKWGPADYESWFDANDGFQLSAHETADIRARLRTCGDVATALAHSASDDELGLSRVPRIASGDITFHVYIGRLTE